MKKLLFCLIPLPLLLLAACGSAQDSLSIDVAGLDSFAFEPESITVPAAAEVTINFDNVGSLQHSWVVVGPGTRPLLATLDDALNGASSGDVVGGESATFTFITPADPGDYDIVCTIPGHAVGGMVGTLTVTSE